MALQLAPEEPEAGPWRVELLSTVANAVTRRRPDSSGRPAVLAVDGRSNNGKTTVATRIGELVPGSVVIHTDAIAWEHSRFGWADLLIVEGDGAGRRAAGPPGGLIARWPHSGWPLRKQTAAAAPRHRLDFLQGNVKRF